MIFLKDYSCRVCGMKPEDFISSQKLGCEFCYLFLEKELKILIKNVQDDAEKHVGKRSNSNTLYNFFVYVLEERMKSNPEDAQVCEEILELVADYFRFQ
jgi:protein-arginine kinase activator protein McsA